MAEEEEQVVPAETEEEVGCTSLCASLSGPIYFRLEAICQ